VTAGRFVDNRLARVTVEGWNGFGIEIVMHQAGGVEGLPPTMTRIAMYGAEALAFRAALETACAVEEAAAAERGAA
jgi:hypothetical protein